MDRVSIFAKMIDSTSYWDNYWFVPLPIIGSQELNERFVSVPSFFPILIESPQIHQLQHKKSRYIYISGKRKEIVHKLMKHQTTVYICLSMSDMLIETNHGNRLTIFHSNKPMNFGATMLSVMSADLRNI